MRKRQKRRGGASQSFYLERSPFGSWQAIREPTAYLYTKSVACSSAIWVEKWSPLQLFVSHAWYGSIVLHVNWRLDGSIEFVLWDGERVSCPCWSEDES